MWTVMITFGGRRDGQPVTRIGERAWVGRFKSPDLADAAAESWRTDPVFVWEAKSVRVANEPVVTRPPRRRTPVRMVGSWRRR